MKKKIKKMGLLFWGSETPTFWLGLPLFIKRESRTPTFKILVRTLLPQRGCRSDIYIIRLHFSPSSLDFVPKSHTSHKANPRAEPMQHTKDTVFHPTAATNVA